MKFAPPWRGARRESRKCEFCGKNCGAPKARIIRAATTENYVKTILCPQCDERFLHCSDYRLHQNIHVITCELCGLRFPKLKNYEHHKTSVHPSAETPQEPIVAVATTKPVANENDKSSANLYIRKVECDFCGKKCATPKSRILHEATHREDKKIVCPRCEERFTHYWQYKTHKDEHLTTCEICKKKFVKLSNLELHKMKVHMSEEERENKKREMHTCTICGFLCLNKAYLAKHMVTRHGQYIHPCSFCDRKFKRPHEVQIHVYVTHSGLDPQGFKCEVCQRGFKTNALLQLHLKKHREEYSTFCDACGKGFYSTSTYKEHYKYVHEGVRIKCDQCEKTFTNKSNLLEHQKKHDPNHVVQTFPCDQCEKFFYKLSLLENHVRVKHLNQLHVCEVCGKGLTSATSLKEHMYLHTGKKPYVCTTCGKAFNKRTLLTTHSVVHTKEKRFVCAICDKSYTQKSTLNIHTKQAHSDERPFVCNICAKGFVTRSLLNMHMKSHEAVKKE